MKPTVPKIIIKPRQPPAAQPVAGTSSRLIAAAPPTPEANTPRDDDGTEGDGEDSQAMDVDGADENPQTGDEEGGSRMGTPRPRGRPRGRGRGLGAGTSTPRARGRGRGRGRPRGGRGALTIRLPKRGDEDGDGGADGDVEREGTTEAEAADAEGAQEEGEEPKEKEAPLGGGKPFRKIQGKVYIIEGDEFITDDDPKGDEKIDSSGSLLGGRRFKASTFVLPTRHPTRQYMLAIDAARTSGFRDSLYYFRRNLLAFKLNATQPEKDYLIAEGKLGSHLRTRSVTLITARSAFKLHGSKMVVDGKWVVDDYYEEKMLEEITPLGLKAGDPVGDLPDPNAASHGNDLSQAANANANASSKVDRGGGGGGGIYRAGGPTTIFGGSGWGPFSDGPLNAVRKSILSRDGVAEENWMYMMASRVADAGDEWAKWRKEGLKVGGGGEGLIPTVVEDFPDVAPKKSKERRLEDYEEDEEEEDDEEEGVEPVEPVAKRRRVGFEGDELPLGVYEAHTGVVHYRADTQPTRSRWEALPDPDKRVLGGSKAGNGAWALAWIDTVVELPQPGEPNSPGAKTREKLLKEVGESLVVDSTLDP